MNDAGGRTRTSEVSGRLIYSQVLLPLSHTRASVLDKKTERATTMAFEGDRAAALSSRSQGNSVVKQQKERDFGSREKPSRSDQSSKFTLGIGERETRSPAD